MNAVRTLFIGIAFALALPLAAHAQQIGCPDTGCPLPPGPTQASVTANAVTTSTTANHAVTIQLSGTSSDSGTLVFATSSNPTSGTLGSLQLDNSIVYTPDTNFVGHDSFSFEVTEGALSDAATVDISITAPTVTAADVSASATAGVATTSSFSASSSDGGTLTYATSSNPAHGTLAISGSSFTYTPDAAYTGSDSFDYAASEGALASSTAHVTLTVSAAPAPADSATLAIRDGSVLIGPVSITLPDANAAAVAIAPTGSSTTYAVPARSVLALLTGLDAATSTFNITDLAYSNSFSSFLLNCIAIEGGAASGDCYSWTYAVNGSFPAVGMDHTALSNGDTAYIFFGDSIKVATDKSSVATGESFTVTVTKYDPASGTYVAAPGEVVGAVQFDANFNSTEFATSTTDASGQATLTLGTAGSYSVGTQDTGYFPNASVTVSAPVPANSGGGGGISHLTFNVPLAFTYLAARQSSNGSWGDDRLTDWAALAYAAGDQSTARQLLANYLLSAHPTLATITDYERHAMALEALGINPYSGAGTDFITPIVSAFDGTKVSSLVNADIFAIIPLLHAGYSASDTIVQKLASYVIAQQGADGSWGDPDTTAAGIQALAPLSSISGVSAAVAKAETYLKSQQHSNGSFGSQNPDFTTPWAMQAIAALNESQTSWAPGGFYPSDYLAGLQQNDGGVDAIATDTSTRIWATEFAIPAALGKTWNALLSSFSKPAAAANTAVTTTSTTTHSAASSTTATATTTAATSSAPVATTTLPIATSTAATTTSALSLDLPVPGTPHLESPIAKPAHAAKLSASSTPAPTVTVAAAKTAQVAAAASALPHVDYGSLWFLLFLILLTIFLGIVGWSITGAYFNRER